MVTKDVKIPRKGQIPIPIEIREALGIEEGDVVTIHQDEDRFSVQKREDWATMSAGRYRPYATKPDPLEPAQIRELAVRYWTEDMAEEIELEVVDGRDQ